MLWSRFSHFKMFEGYVFSGFLLGFYGCALLGLRFEVLLRILFLVVYWVFMIVLEIL